MLLNERQEVQKAKLRSKEDFAYLQNHKTDITGYFYSVGSNRLHYLTWDAISSSGNLIKLDNDEIQIIQFVHQSVIFYNDRMGKLQEIALRLLVNEFSKDPAPIPEAVNYRGVDILHYYIKNYEQRVNETIEAFKELNRLSWFDMTKSKT